MTPVDANPIQHPNPALRLVNAGVVPTRHSSRRSITQVHDHPAPEIDQTDPRWAFTVRVASQIEGGRAAILRPERRERLLRLAANLGFSPFDAALIIAMVQDTARRGESQPGYAPLSPHLAHRVAESLPAMPRAKNRAKPTVAVSILQKLLGATIIATAMVAAAILWMQAGS